MRGSPKAVRRRLYAQALLTWMWERWRVISKRCVRWHRMGMKPLLQGAAYDRQPAAGGDPAPDFGTRRLVSESQPGRRSDCAAALPGRLPGVQVEGFCRRNTR